MNDIGTMAAFGRGLANQGRPLKVFDWNKAAEMLKAQQPGYAEAGLDGDWGATGGTIWSHGKPVTKDATYTYLASNWATPCIEINGERIPCWIAEADVPTEWGDDPAKVYWPASALQIVGKN